MTCSGHSYALTFEYLRTSRNARLTPIVKPRRATTMPMLSEITVVIDVINVVAVSAGKIEAIVLSPLKLILGFLFAFCFL